MIRPRWSWGGFVAFTFVTGLAGMQAGLQAQEPPAVGREAARSLRFPELEFRPPQAQRESIGTGVPVFFMEDHSLPLVTLYARFRGGYAVLPRTEYAAASALAGLLRAGGTTSLSPDSVEALLDFYALQTTFGGGGESTFSSLNTLTRHLEPAVELWTDLLRHPRFDSLEVEIWRDRQMEATRRRTDEPGLLAVSEFNRIMFGDHPVGWEMEEEDLAPGRLNAATISRVHSTIFCPENLVLGVSGDVRWEEVRPLLELMVAGWPSCPAPLPEPPMPELRRGRSVFLIPRPLTQSTIVMAMPGGVVQGAQEDYFASRIGNSILGSSGFSSRLVSRVRTEMGLAYGVSSFWTTPSRWEGIVGATTQTKSESTVAATRLLLEIMREMRDRPPSRNEVDEVVSQIVNSFVFNFQDPAQIVSRQIYYLAQGLPEDWLERYVRGIQGVSPSSVQDVFRRYLDPDEMIILVVGDPSRFDLPLEVLGEVQIWPVQEGDRISGSPGEGLRYPR